MYQMLEEVIAGLNIEAIVSMSIARWAAPGTQLRF